MTRPKTTYRLPSLRCTRCGHEWVPRRSTPPLHCARCNSPYWDRPRQKPPPDPDGDLAMDEEKDGGDGGVGSGKWLSGPTPR